MKALFIGIIILIVYFIILFIVMYFFTKTNSNKSEMVEIEAVKNNGCSIYVKQNPPCSDWNKVNVTWQENEVTLKEFMKNENTFNCSNERYARIICDCPSH